MPLRVSFLDYFAKPAFLPVSDARTIVFSEQCTYAVYLPGKWQLVTL
jgi:hypothetical protein